MARHQVIITNIPRLLIGANDIVFEVKENNAKLGELRVSQGNIFWLPSGSRRGIGRVLKWSKFDQLIKVHGKRKRYLSKT